MSQNSLALRQCLAYLDRVKNLEMQCYQLERLSKNINYQLRQAKINMQNAQKKTLPDLPEKPAFFKGLIQMEIFAVLISAVLGVIWGGIEWILKMNAVNHKSFIWYASAAAVGVGIALVIAAFFLQVFVFLSDRADYPKQVQRRMEEERKTNDSITLFQQQVLRYTQELKSCETALSRSKATLKRYYDQNILYPKYRGLVPVFTIYEYMEAGLCTTLTGHEGAYNIYEQELRFNRIMGKLDDIIARLDEISANQMLLAQEIRNSNSKIDRISSSLSRLEKSSEATRYYSSITASNAEYLSWISTVSFIEMV